MLVHIQFALVAFFLIVSQVLCQGRHPESITCYTKYEHDETIIQPSNAQLSYHYYQTETTRSQTPENEFCSNVGCVCFSYLAVCRGPSAGNNHVSQCNGDDRRHGTMKWHRGWTSTSKCDQMLRESHVYHNLTCCNKDRCNNQPGKITKFVDVAKLNLVSGTYFHQHDPSRADSNDKPLPQRHDSYGFSFPQPVVNSYEPQQQQHHDARDHHPRLQHQPQPQPQYDNHDYHSRTQSQQRYDDTRDYHPRPPSSPQSDTSTRHYHHQPSSSLHTTTPQTRRSTRTPRPNTSRLPDTDRSAETYDKSLSSNTSSLFNSFSNWMIILSLIAYFCNMVRSQ